MVEGPVLLHDHDHVADLGDPVRGSGESAAHTDGHGRRDGEDEADDEPPPA
jgi:hypothetical protein